MRPGIAVENVCSFRIGKIQPAGRVFKHDRNKRQQVSLARPGRFWRIDRAHRMPLEKIVAMNVSAA